MKNRKLDDLSEYCRGLNKKIEENKERLDYLELEKYKTLAKYNAILDKMVLTSTQVSALKEETEFFH